MLKRQASYLMLLLISQISSNLFVNAQNDEVTCTDVQGWKDSIGDDCSWYNTTETCQSFGIGYYNDGNTALTACCSCGGGSHYADTCLDVTMDDGTPWTDSDGDGCSWYSKMEVGDDDVYYDDGDTRCSYYGNEYENVGYTASTACCACGGGHHDVFDEIYIPPVRGSNSPSIFSTQTPSATPSTTTSATPSATPSTTPSATPSTTPSATPSITPSSSPSTTPSMSPSKTPSSTPSLGPTFTARPTSTPSSTPSTSYGPISSIEVQAGGMENANDILFYGTKRQQTEVTIEEAENIDVIVDTGFVDDDISENIVNPLSDDFITDDQTESQLSDECLSTVTIINGYEFYQMQDIVVEFSNCDATMYDWLAMYPEGSIAEDGTVPIGSVSWIKACGTRTCRTAVSEGNIVLKSVVTPLPGNFQVHLLKSFSPPYKVYASSDTFSMLEGSEPPVTVSENPTTYPTATPSSVPSSVPTSSPTVNPTSIPTSTPSSVPTKQPVVTLNPTHSPSTTPSLTPSSTPSVTPTATSKPTVTPSTTPSLTPSGTPSSTPSSTPSYTNTVSFVPNSFPTIPLSSSDCVDIPDWVDSENASCSWYAETTRDDDFYDEDDTRCEKWGNSLDFAKDGFTATMACCVCGGGIRNGQIPGGITDNPTSLPSSSPSTNPPTFGPSMLPSSLPSRLPTNSPTWGSEASTETKIRFEGISAFMNQTVINIFENETSQFINDYIPTSSRPGLADYIIRDLTTTVSFQQISAGVGNVFFLDVTFTVTSTIDILDKSIDFDYVDVVLNGFTQAFNEYLSRLSGASNYFPQYGSGQIIGFANSESTIDDDATSNLPFGEILILCGIVGCAMIIFVLVIQSDAWCTRKPRETQLSDNSVIIKIEGEGLDEAAEIKPTSP